MRKRWKLMLILTLFITTATACSKSEEEADDTSWMDYAVECRRIESYTSMKSVVEIDEDADIVVKPLNLIPTEVEQADSGYCLGSIADIEVQFTNNTDERYIFTENYTLKMWTSNSKGSVTLYTSGIRLEPGETRIETISKIYLGERWMGKMIQDISLRFESIDYELVGMPTNAAPSFPANEEVAEVSERSEEKESEPLENPNTEIIKDTSSDPSVYKLVNKQKALRAAEAYLRIAIYTQDELKKQLIADGYTEEEATYAIEHVEW